MDVTIRPSTPDDAPTWLSLVRAILGDEHPAKKVYDTGWILEEMGDNDDSQAWLALGDGAIQASVTLLSSTRDQNPVTNIARNLFLPESYENGSAEALIRQISDLAEARQEMIVTRVLASDMVQQTLFEKLGFFCVGYQPYKHLHQIREGILFYVKLSQDKLQVRMPMSESLGHFQELASTALQICGLKPPASVRDGVTGYPLKTEIQVQDVTYEDFLIHQRDAAALNPPLEVSGHYFMGAGYMRLRMESPIRAAVGTRNGEVTTGVAYIFDDVDRCVRLVDAFTKDDLSMGAMIQHVVRVAQEELNSVYVEADFVATAPRLLKSAEQLGFIPVAYLPAFYQKDGQYADVVKAVKLNSSYALENTELTTMAQTLVKAVDYSFQDQKIGVAIINLLSGLPIFEGLGDGELRKIARLFTQKLYRPNEKVFEKGAIGHEAYIVMRGQVNILLEENSNPVASVSSGQIFGEQAFLDGAARGGFAVAGQASILLVIQRSAFYELVEREPHLGMVVMRNIAMDLSNKLRRANTALSSGRR